MSGLRERKKIESREKILGVSREIFFTKGYSNVTIEEIAERAGIGTGTVYNFFKTKADILISVVAAEAGMEDQDYRLEDAEIEKGVVDIVMDFTWRSFGKMKYLGKKVWKELFAAMFGLQRTVGHLFKGLTVVDFKYVEKLNALLVELRDRGALAANFDVESASMAIYDTFYAQFFRYVYSEETRFEQLEQDIRRQMGFIFGARS